MAANSLSGRPSATRGRIFPHRPFGLGPRYEDTVAPIVDYDARYGFDLTETLETYLHENCNMNATATAMCAHRHTVAHRLDRVKRLTGLDPLQYEDRERLGLGLKIYRITSGRRPRS
jgi:DNA-binding PucR family transcriptional regulator